MTRVKQQRKPNAPPTPAEQLALLIDELVDKVKTRQRWLRDPDSVTGVRLFEDHQLKHPSLLTAVDTAARPSRLPIDEPGRASDPASKPPIRSEALELLADITAGAEQQRRTLRVALGKTPGARSTVTADLRALVGLVAECIDPRLADRTIRQVRSWVYSARVITAHDAPVVALRDIVCRYCGGELRVRADASSDVWCSAMVWTGWCTVADAKEHRRLIPAKCVEEGERRRTWPRTSWVFLLGQLHDAKQDAEATA